VICLRLYIRNVIKINVIWGKAGIPLKTDERSLDYLIVLLLLLNKNWKRAEENSVAATKNKISFPSRIRRPEEFLADRQKLCNLSASDCYEEKNDRFVLLFGKRIGNFFKVNVNSHKLAS
jgi:hypothetical protein